MSESHISRQARHGLSVPCHEGRKSGAESKPPARPGGFLKGRCLITGGAGFIGSHLAEALTASGVDVLVLDDLSSGRLDNLDEAEALGRLEFVEGSIADDALVGELVKGVDCIFHLAALVAVPESLEKPRRCIELNDLAVFNLYQAAAKAGVRRVVFSSSSAVYGEIEAPHAEDLCPRPATPYALHKLLGEHYGLFFNQYRDLETVYLRYFNVYGPRQLPDSPYSGVISLFMDKLCHSERGLIFDDGSQTRDFVYVDDVVRANLAAAVRPGIAGESFNVGSGRATSILDLYRLIASLAGREELEPVFAPPRAGDIRHSFGPVDKARRLLGYEAETDLAEGLERTWRWFSSGHPHR